MDVEAQIRLDDARRALSELEASVPALAKAIDDLEQIYKRAGSAEEKDSDEEILRLALEGLGASMRSMGDGFLEMSIRLAQR